MIVRPFSETLACALREPTLLDALAFVALMECERAIAQAMRKEIGPDGKGWDTCFRHCFEHVFAAWPMPDAQALAAAERRGAERERDAVVRWLLTGDARHRGTCAYDATVAPIRDELAADIERGAHLETDHAR